MLRLRFIDLKGLILSALVLLLVPPSPSTRGEEISVHSLADLKRCIEGVTSEPGDICLVAPGTYELSALAEPTLTVSLEDLTVRSQQGPDVTLLKGDGATVFRVVAGGVTINGFTLSNSGPFPLIEVGDRAGEGIRIINNILTDEAGSYTDGVWFSSLEGFRGIAIVNNVFRGGGGSAIHFQNIARLEDVDIIDNIIRSMGGAGVSVEAIGRVERFTLSGRSFCEVSDVEGAGLRFHSVQILKDVTLFNCAITGNATGLDMVDGTTVEGLGILGSEIAENRGWGVVLAGGVLSDIRIIDDDIRENREGGLSLSSSGQVERLNISRNRMDRNGGTGASVAVGEALSGLGLSENRVSENASDGVTLTVDQSLSGAVVEGNEIGKNGDTGLLLQVEEDLQAVTVVGNAFSKNGRHGLGMATGEEIEGVTLLENEFISNGGLGLHLQGRDLFQMEVELNIAGGNGDHGMMIEAEGSAGELLFRDNKALGNDNNADTIGTGIYLDVGEDLTNAVFRGNIANDNSAGVEVGVKATTGRASQVVLRGNQAQDNRNQGIRIESQGDLADLLVEDNSFLGNGTNLALIAKRGSGISVKGNDLKGAPQIGLLLDSSGVMIAENTLEGNSTGVVVKRASNNFINANNFINNRKFGVYAKGLPSGEAVNAEENWWGHPSGPGGAGPGSGDAVTAAVDFDPWLREPAAVTGAFFQITDVQMPGQIEVGATAIITVTVTNTGSEEGTQDIAVRIADPSGDVVKEETRRVPLDPAASATITVQHTFGRTGTFAVTVSTEDAMVTRTLVVGVGGGGPGPSVGIAEALDVNGNNRIDDDEILTAIRLWISGEPVPGTGGQVIDDATITELIRMWITGAPVR